MFAAKQGFFSTAAGGETPFDLAAAETDIGVVTPSLTFGRNPGELSFCGLDANNAPVFALSWITVSNVLDNMRFMLFRVNSDATITQGNIYQPDANAAIVDNFINQTELEGCGFGATSGYEDYGYLAYYNNTATDLTMNTFSFDKANLTASFGTPNAVLNGGNNLDTIIYLGNRQAAAGYRNTNKIDHYTITRTSSSLGFSANSTAWVTFTSAGGSGGYTEKGFGANNFVSIGYGNNLDGCWVEADRYVDPATFYQSTNEKMFDGGEVNEVEPYLNNLNNTDKYMATQRNTSTGNVGVYLQVGVVTWNTGNVVPTIAFGTQVEFANAVVPCHTVTGHADDAGMVFHCDTADSNTKKYKNFTVSGNVITLDGSYTNVANTAQTGSNVVPFASRAISDGTNDYFVVVSRNFSTGNVMVHTMVNPT